MFSLNRLSALLIIVTLGLVSFFAVPWPSRTMLIAGQDVSVSGKLLVAAAVLGLVACGTQALASSSECDNPWCMPAASGLWILPTVLSALALLALNRSLMAGVQFLICSATAATLVMLLLAEQRSVDAHSRLRLASRTVLEVAAFLLMALVMTTLKTEQVSGPFLAGAAAAGGAVLAYVVLSGDLHRPLRISVCAVVSGLVVAVVALGLSQVVKTPVTYGLVLTVALYVSIGLLRGYLRGKLRKVIVIEYLIVAGIALLIVLLSVH